MREARPEGPPLGALSLGFLVVAVLSGIGLVPFYRPEAALESVEALQAGLPWAFLLRGVHAFGALGFLLTTVLHLLDVLLKGGLDRVPSAIWWRSTLLVPVGVAAMLTGFVLRGDAEAMAALQVGRGVLGSIPLVGSGLAALFLGPNGGGLGAVALHHAGTFTVLPWLLSIEHGRRVWPDARSWVIALLASVAVAGAVPVPLGPAAATGEPLLGPWYLLGLQGMLLDLPVATAWVVPLLTVTGLGVLPRVRGRARTAVVSALCGMAMAWAAWTVRLLVAGAP